MEAWKEPCQDHALTLAKELEARVPGAYTGCDVRMRISFPKH